MRAQTYKARVDAGLCAHCGVDPQAAGTTTCTGCAKEQAERDHARREDRKAAGLCITCRDKPPESGSVRCAGCNEKYQPAGAANVTTARRAKERKCRDCETPLLGEVATRCDDCLAVQAEKQKVRRETRKAAGLCVGCGKRAPIPGKTRCPTCTRKRSRRDIVHPHADHRADVVQ